MPPVRVRRREDDLGIAGQGQDPAAVAVIGESNAPDLDVVVGGDDNFSPHRDVMFPALELDLVREEQDLLTLWLRTERLPADGPQIMTLEVADIDPCPEVFER